MRYSLLFLGFISSCGRAGDAPSPIVRHYAPDIQEAVDAFMADFPARYSPYYPTIEWKDLPGNYAGLCWDMLEYTARIELDTAYKGLPAETKWLVYHEMGHCVLGLGHDKASRSIMSVTMTQSPELDWDKQVKHMRTLKREYP